MMLALRPKIHPLETMHAYTLRLANANGLNTEVRHFTPIFAPFRKVPSAPARVSRP